MTPTLSERLLEKIQRRIRHHDAAGTKDTHDLTLLRDVALALDGTTGTIYDKGLLAEIGRQRERAEKAEAQLQAQEEALRKATALPPSLVERVEEILSPALDVRAPYARQMVHAIVSEVGKVAAFQSRAQEEAIATLRAERDRYHRSREKLSDLVSRIWAVIPGDYDETSIVDVVQGIVAERDQANELLAAHPPADREALPQDGCENNCPPTWTGHWRDWHRGHGCSKDPEAAREAREAGQKDGEQ